MPEIVSEKGFCGEAAQVVLVVDDEEVVRGFLSRVLAAAGYQVVSASNGFEALALLQAATVALVITDIRMPGMSGLELGMRISRLPLAPPVVYASASDHPPPSAAEFYLQKPFSSGELTRRVREILSAGANH